jgi:chromosomal replication initiation ATPase DnaA
MYLVHTLLGRNYKEVGVLFGRDRTTVSHACARTEDRREDKSPFEVDVTAIESILREEANCG